MDCIEEDVQFIQSEGIAKVPKVHRTIYLVVFQVCVEIKVSFVSTSVDTGTIMQYNFLLGK